MASRTMSAAVLVCSVFVGLAVGSRFKDMNLTNSKSPYSPGESALGSAPPPCWCGPNTDCSWSVNGTKLCTCTTGYIGSHPECQPSAELWSLCFKNNPCGLHAECEVENGTRSCPYCVLPYEGTPPDCIPPDECRDVTRACGPNAVCDATYSPICSCARGFVGNPPNCTAGPALLALCDPYPCGAHADCRVAQDGGLPVCACARNYVGTPPHCEPSPEMWRVCFKAKPCGRHSKCVMVNRVAVCSPCDAGYSGKTPFCYNSVY